MPSFDTPFNHTLQYSCQSISDHTRNRTKNGYGGEFVRVLVRVCLSGMLYFFFLIKLDIYSLLIVSCMQYRFFFFCNWAICTMVDIIIVCYALLNWIRKTKQNCSVVLFKFPNGCCLFPCSMNVIQIPQYTAYTLFDGRHSMNAMAFTAQPYVVCWLLNVIQWTQ